MRNILFILLFTIIALSASDEAPPTETSIPSELAEYELSCTSDDKSQISARSCFVAASMYYEKKELYYDPFKSIELFKEGCAKGNEHSCNAIAYCYHRGKNIKQDVNKAILLYKYSCKTGLKNACYNLGLIYENGDGVKKDLKKAKYYYGVSCNLKFSDGCTGYAELNNKGSK